jgi:hypothetical protein
LLFSSKLNREVVFCILHCLLNVVDRIREHIIAAVGSHEDAQEAVMYLKSKAFRFKYNVDKNKWLDLLGKKSFTGAGTHSSNSFRNSIHLYSHSVRFSNSVSECKAFLQDIIHDKFLDICFKGKNPVLKADLSRLIKQFRELFTQMEQVHRKTIVITNHLKLIFKITILFVCLQVDSSGDRVKQAAAIRESSIAFAAALCKVIPPAGVTLYMHFLVMHVPDMIERHGNVVRFGGQGLSMFSLTNQIARFLV